MASTPLCDTQLALFGLLFSSQVLLLSEGLSAQVCRCQDVERALDPLLDTLRYSTGITVPVLSSQLSAPGT